MEISHASTKFLVVKLLVTKAVLLKRIPIMYVLKLVNNQFVLAVYLLLLHGSLHLF